MFSPLRIFFFLLAHQLQITIGILESLCKRESILKRKKHTDFKLSASSAEEKKFGRGHLQGFHLLKLRDVKTVSLVISV